jgi:hypothetical protein
VGVQTHGAVILHDEWDDTQQMALALRDVGANVPNLTQYGTSGLYFPQFDIDDLLCFSIQLPHGYREGTSVEPHVHWCGDTVDTDVVKWELNYQWLNPESDVIAAAATTITCQEAVNTAGITKLTGFPTVAKADAKISSIFAGNIRRIANGTGTEAAGNIFLQFFDLHFRRNTAGSRQEYVK